MASLDAWTFRMDFAQAKLPGEERLGLTGISLLADTSSGFYLGPSLQAALRGQRGGFFAGGLEGGLRVPLTSRLRLDGGIFLGGGGGGSAPVGGGLLIRPRLGLTWGWAHSRLGLGLNHIRFPNGEIRSTQAYVTWEGTLASLRLQGHPEAPLLKWPTSWPLHLERESLELRATRYSQPGGLFRTTGRNETSTLDQLGITWGHALSETLFYQVEASAAARGGSAGYMEVLGGLGARFFLDEGRRLSLHGVLSAGSGGGGGIGTGGGFLVKGSGGARFSLTPSVHLVAEVGRVAAPSTSFRATTLSLGAGVSFDFAEPGEKPNRDLLASAPSSLAWRVSSGFQYLGSVARKDGAPSAPLEQFVLKAELLLSDRWYATGQSGWATGGKAGAWATGLLGLGLQTPALHGHRLKVELAAGAGGGGGVDSRGGALVQAMGGWNWDFAPSWSVHLMGGRVRAAEGGFSTSVVDLGLGFRGTRLVNPRR